MTIEFLTFLKDATFSGFETHTNSDPFPHNIVTQNLFRVSIWGVLSSGSTALASYIFNKTLTHEGSWKTFAAHVFKASLASFLTFAVVASCIVYKSLTQDNDDFDDLYANAFNERVSLFAKGSTLIGLAGAAAAWTAQSATSNLQVSSLAKYSLSPLLGFGAVGSVLWIFFNWQNNQLEALKEKK